MEFNNSKWRLILSPPERGAWNMALDEAILESCGRGESPPTLRLYAWEPPCLSLGYAQPVADVNLEALKERGWDLVRRPTGGRAILHTDELTYSVCGPVNEPRLTGGVLQSYRILSRALLRALELLNIPAETLEKPAKVRDLERLPSKETSISEPKNPVCFEEPSNYEITVGGKKLIGSAQARRKDGVLQHGSLPLCGDLGRIVEVLKFSGKLERLEARRRLLKRATTVEEILGEVISWDKATQAFIRAFREALNLDLQPGEPQTGELNRAGELAVQKYNHPAWINHL